MLKRTVSLRRFFWVPTTYVWLRNKTNNFSVRTLIWRSDSIMSISIKRGGWYSHIFYMYIGLTQTCLFYFYFLNRHITPIKMFDILAATQNVFAFCTLTLINTLKRVDCRNKIKSTTNIADFSGDLPKWPQKSSYPPKILISLKTKLFILHRIVHNMKRYAWSRGVCGGGGGGCKMIFDSITDWTG